MAGAREHGFGDQRVGACAGMRGRRIYRPKHGFGRRYGDGAQGQSLVVGSADLASWSVLSSTMVSAAVAGLRQAAEGVLWQAASIFRSRMEQCRVAAGLR